MACTCGNSHTNHEHHRRHPRTPNRCCTGSCCRDLGCINIVYPDCILTKASYPCINVAAGKTGTVLFAAIDTAICALQTSSGSSSAAITIIQGDIVTINNSITVVQGDLSTINDTVNILVTQVDDLDNALHDATACLYDSTGGCEIDNLQLEITTINNDITTIEGDIVTINNAILALQDETFKTLGDAGNMENGQPIPAVTADVTLQAVARLRRHSANHAEVNLLVNVEVNGFGIGTIFTLPTGYRPSTTLQYGVAGTSSTSTDTYVGFVRVATTGVVTLNVITLSADTNFQLGWNVLVPTD